MPSKRSASDLSALLLGQWFGSGRSKIAPGTVGSLAALPLFWLLHAQSLSVYWGVTLFITLAGFWASQRCSELLGDNDPQSVVIDEVAGVLIALGIVSAAAPVAWGIAWLLFRLLDITKPGLIDRVQYWPPHGVGIMADDLLAGLVAGGLTYGGVLLFAS